jgi:hypothetical protein
MAQAKTPAAAKACVGQASSLPLFHLAATKQSSQRTEPGARICRQPCWETSSAAFRQFLRFVKWRGKIAEGEINMFALTTEQQNAISSGKPVPFVLNETECIVVRKDVFERMKNVAYDDSEWTREEMLALAAQAFDDADTAGPIE